MISNLPFLLRSVTISLKSIFLCFQEDGVRPWCPVLAQIVFSNAGTSICRVRTARRTCKKRW